MNEIAWRGRLFRAADDPLLCRDVQKFRKGVFVDQLGWSLSVRDGLEQDQFDRPDAFIFALLRGRDVAGCFRALPCDKPYLSREVFPSLAETLPYPRSPDCWEISRLAAASRDASGPLYAALLDFGWSRRARALVALVDLGHERVLRSMGIRTRRYGAPAAVGIDRNGRPIRAVAGEIPLGEQSSHLRLMVATTLSNMDMTDETLVLRSHRIPA